MYFNNKGEHPRGSSSYKLLLSWVITESLGSSGKERIRIKGMNMSRNRKEIND
jgi:hypothetical protein